MHDSEKLHHESFGKVTVSRTSGGSSPMFGSDVPHRHTIKVQIEKATLQREAGIDWIMGDGHLLEFEMTEVQWANFVSAIGCGTGTPVSLRMYPTGPLKFAEPVPDLPAQFDVIRQEFKDRCEKATGQLSEAESLLRDLIEKPGSVKKSDLRELHTLLYRGKQQVDSNLPFIAKQFDERGELTRERIKLEMEAHWQYLLQAFGEDAARIVLQQHREREAQALIEGSVEAQE